MTVYFSRTDATVDIVNNQKLYLSRNYTIPGTLPFQELNFSRSYTFPEIIPFQKLYLFRNYNIPGTLPFQDRRYGWLCSTTVYLSRNSTTFPGPTVRMACSTFVYLSRNYTFPGPTTRLACSTNNNRIWYCGSDLFSRGYWEHLFEPWLCGSDLEGSKAPANCLAYTAARTTIAVRCCSLLLQWSHCPRCSNDGWTLNAGVDVFPINVAMINTVWLQGKWIKSIITTERRIKMQYLQLFSVCSFYL